MVVTVPALPFSYLIRRSPRATRVRIIVSLNKIEVVAPPAVTEQHLHKFVSDKQQWILASQSKLLSKMPAQPTPIRYSAGSLIPFQGQHYPLTIALTQQKQVKVHFNNHFIIQQPDSLNDEQAHDAIKTALTQWLKQQAKVQVHHYVSRHATTYQLKPRSIIIRQQKSRWGSCGIHNDININWLLIMAPPEVLEYVVVHELCHIKERNHSPAFWRLVAHHLPNYQQQRAWLKQHGLALMQSV